jgi:hypothetical protein
MNCLLTFVYPKEDSRNAAVYDDRRCKRAVKVNPYLSCESFSLDQGINKVNMGSEKQTKEK